MVYVTDDEWVDFVGEERRRRTGPSQNPVTAPHPDYSYNTTSAYDWSEPDFQWADTLPDAGAGNDPFGYMDMGQIGIQPDRPTFDPWEGDQFQDLMGIGVDNRADQTYGLNFDWTFAPGMDSGGLDTMQPTDRGPDVMMGVDELPGWDPSMSTATFDGGYGQDGFMQGLVNPLGSALKDAGQAAFPYVDKYLLKPTDALTEISWDALNAGQGLAFGPAAADLVSGVSKVIPWGMDFEGFNEAFSETGKNARDPMGAAEDFRDRPWQEQAALGVGFDPTNLIPFNLGAAKGAYADLLGPEGKLVEALAKAQGREGLAPAIGLGIDEVGDAATALKRGAEVFDLETGKTLRVTRAFTGDETGVVVLKDPDTGETVRRVRGALADPPPGAAVQAPEAPPPGPTLKTATATPGEDPWRLAFGDPESATGAFGTGTTPGGRPPVPGRGNTVPQPDTPRWQLPDPDRFGNPTEAQRIALRDFGEKYASAVEQLRISGVTEREIAEGRAGQVARLRAARESATEAGLEGKAASDFVNERLASGRLAKTAPDIPDSVRAEVDYLFDVINRAYPNRHFDWLTADQAFTDALEGGVLQPHQRDILEAVFGDKMPDVVRVAGAVGHANIEASTIPMDLGPLSRSVQPPLIGDGNTVTPAATNRDDWRAVFGERGRAERADLTAQFEKEYQGFLDAARKAGHTGSNESLTFADEALHGSPVPAPGRFATDASAPQSPIDAIARRDAAWERWTEAEMRAQAAERRATGTSLLDVRGERSFARHGRPLTEEGRAAEVADWQRRLAAAPDQAAATEAMRLRETADRLRAQLDDADAYIRPESPRGAAGGGSGPEMNSVIDRSPAGDLTLRAQTQADADLGVIPIPGKPRSMAVQLAGQRNETMRAKVRDTLVDLLNLPRSMKASLDFSASLRQAAPLGASHPRAWARAFATQFKAARSEEAAEAIYASLDASPYAGLREKAGLFQGHLAGRDVNMREEAFASRLTGKMPGLRGTERAYVVMLDKLRADVFDDTVSRWLRAGRNPTEEETKALAAFINHATGRGTGDFLDKHGNALAMGLFSPRYMISRPQMLVDLVTAPGPVRKEAAKGVGIWAAGIVGLGGLATLAGGEFGVNPLKGDFGRTSIGKHSWDTTGGWATDIRTMARLLNGEAESGSGNRYKVNRPAIIGRYFENKLSPNAGVALDILQGHDYNGNATNLRALDGVTTNAMNLFGNLFMQEAYRNFKAEMGGVELGPNFSTVTSFAKWVASTALGAFGWNTSVNVPETPVEKFDAKWQGAALFKGRTWNDLNSDEKAALERQYGQRPNSSNPAFAASQRQGDIIKFNRQTREYQAANAYEKALAGAKTETEKRDAGRMFREELSRIGDITNAEYNQWAQGKDFGPQNPLDAARSAYFDTFKAATANGVMDEEKQQALLAKLEASWTPEQKAYVEAAIGRKKESADPTLQALYDAQAAIRESGYYDLTEGKAKWRQAHPEIDALLRKYGYGETTTKAMDTDARLNAEQKADDLKLRDANFSEAETKAWRERYDERETARAAAKDVLYGDLPPRERDALSMYYEVVKGMTAANGEIDWGGVERWLAGAPKDVRNAVENRPDNASTPMVREMKRDRREIGDSGYWDVADAAAKQFTNGQYNSMNKLRQDVYNSAYRQSMAKGLTELQAKVLAENMTADYLSDVDEMVSKWRTNFRRQPENAEIVKKLIKWGYWTPGKKDSVAIAGQPGLNW